MHIALLGPIAGAYVEDLLPEGIRVPAGYSGAPLMGELIRGLLRKGHRVTAITTDSTLALDAEPLRLQQGAFTLIVCPARPRAWRPNGLRLGRAVDGFRFEVAGLASELSRVAADVIHAHWSYEFALAALRIRRNSLITCHDSPTQILRFTKSAYRFVRLLMARRVFNKGLAYTTVSSYMAEQLRIHHGINAQVIPNPVSEQLLTSGSDRAGPQGRRIVMINNGWDARKNVEQGVRGFIKWSSQEPTAELHLFGNGYEPGALAERALHQAGLASSRIVFRGAVSHGELMNEMLRADALLHTALEESFGVVLAESMALGIPVVAGRDSGAVPWVLGFGSGAPAGIAADVRSADGIADALRHLFSGPYESYSRAGRNRVRDHFLVDAVVDRYLDTYAELV